MPNLNQIPTPLDEVIKTFSFLISDFGFSLLEARQDKKYNGEYLAIFRNDTSKLQLEIAAGSNYFHCEIRRLLNGQPAKYSDIDNCIGFESLAILESNNNYDHFNYFAAGSTGLQGVLINTAALFQRHKTFFTTDCWIDTKRIEALRDKDFENKFGVKPAKDKKTFFIGLKEEVIKFLTEKGFTLTADSAELPPYDSSQITEHIIFEKDNTTIKITAEDWRDFYYIYHIKLNDSKVFEIDTSKFPDLNKAVEITMEKLIKLI